MPDPHRPRERIIEDWREQPIVAPSPAPWPPGQITVIQKPLSEEDVRRVVREELNRHARREGRS